MPDDTRREEEVLEKLSEAVRTEWAKKHPLTEQQRAAVREALKKSKDRERSQEERRKRAEEQQKRLMEETKKVQQQTRSR